MLENTIHAGAESTLTWLKTKDPSLKQLLDKAYGYAVFPAVGRASVVLGGARGHGEVFEHGKPIGFATLSQMTIGVQVGGQTFSELILFNSKDALDAFKGSKVSFTANASAVIVKAGATGTSDFRAVVAKAYSRGGMLLEASIGGQKLTFRKHLLKSDQRKKDELPVKKSEEPEQQTKAAPQEHEQEHEEEAETSEGASAAAGEEEHEDEPQEPQESAKAAGSEEQEGEEEEYEAAPEVEEADEEGEEEYQAGDETAGEAEAAARESDEDEVEASPPPVKAPPPRTRPQGHNGSPAPVEEVEELTPDANASGGVKQRLAGSSRKLVGKVAHFLTEHSTPTPIGKAAMHMAGKKHPTIFGKPLQLLNKLKGAATGLDKEATLGPVLSDEVNAALRRMIDHDPGLRGLLEEAYGYAVFPLVGKASAVLGVGYGRGEVFEKGKLIGYAGIVQLTLGVQVGGQTYDELVVFENEGALERFKSGNLAFAANVSAAIVKAGAAATTNYSSGTAVFVHPEGGLILEIAIGGQKFIYRKKGMGAPEVKLPEKSEAKPTDQPEKKDEASPPKPRAAASKRRTPGAATH